MKKTLFLHFGPGGHAHIEKKWLSSKYNEVEFWNQPKVRDRILPFSELISECCLHLKQSSTTQIIGHSFGADLALEILHQKTLTSPKIVLISPLLNLHQAIENLGESLHHTMSQVALKNAITESRKKRNAETFWPLIQAVAQHPSYYSSFWKSKSAFKEYMNAMAQAPAFDFEEWQSVINNYLFEFKSNQDRIGKTTEVFAIFGAEDPYFYQSTHFDDWKSILGQNQVLLIEDCGHFPHLEKPDIVANAIKNWLA